MPEVSERVFHTGSDISGATGETLWLRCARSDEPRALWFLEEKVRGAIKSSSRPLVQRLYLLDMWQDRRSFLEPFLGVHNSSGTVGSNRAPVSTDFSNCYSSLSLLSIFLFSEVSFCFFSFFLFKPTSLKLQTVTTSLNQAELWFQLSRESCKTASHQNYN